MVGLKILLVSIVLGVMFSFLVNYLTVEGIYNYYRYPVELYFYNAFTPILTIIVGFPIGNKFRKK